MMIAMILCDQNRQTYYSRLRTNDSNFLIPGYYEFLIVTLLSVLEREVGVDMSRGTWRGSLREE